MRATGILKASTSGGQKKGGLTEIKEFVYRKIFPHNYDTYISPYYTPKESYSAGDIEATKKVRLDFKKKSLSKKSGFHYYLRDPSAYRAVFLFHVKPDAKTPEGPEPIAYRQDHQFKELYDALGIKPESEMFQSFRRVLHPNPNRIGTVTSRFLDPPLYTWTLEGPARFIPNPNKKY